VRIITDGGRLRWRGLGPPTEHRHSDVFDIVAEPTAWPGNKTVQFISTVEGNIESLMVPLEPAVAPIVFRRLP
jgi:hypothetical protein